MDLAIASLETVKKTIRRMSRRSSTASDCSRFALPREAMPGRDTFTFLVLLHPLTLLLFDHGAPSRFLAPLFSLTTRRWQ
jgi:hypothetical protein